ncbi:MAG: TlpA family protein disulfide reductase [Planctomycetales bacterium]|nr:TlpA family protein disulfide reductase [Planctomycetales bacterium]
MNRFPVRRLLTLSLAACAFVLALYVMRAHGEPTEDESPFALPDTTDVDKLLEFAEDVRDARPGRPRGPAEYRALHQYLKHAPAAIQAATEKVLTLEKDKKSESYAAASGMLLESKVMGFAEADAEGRKAMLGAVVDHLKKYGVRRTEASIAYGISSALEDADEKLAGQAYADFAALIEKSDDEEIRSFASAFAGPARRLNLLGSKMDVFGVKLDGTEFDWDEYADKVVLIDFWATWCGPCVAELPNVKEAYDKYHDKGFDVIGVNLDKRRFALDQFLAKNPLPWTQLHSEEPEGNLADHYGISAIPFIVLVGRDGKVISTHARGRELGRLLEEQFPSKPAAE